MCVCVTLLHHVCGVCSACVRVKSYTNVTAIFQDKLKENNIGVLYKQMATMWPTHKVDKNQTKIPVASTVRDFVHKFHSWLCLPIRRPILHVGGGPLLFLWDISKCPEGCVSLSVCPHKGKDLLSSAAHNTADPCSIRDGLSGMYRLPASYRDLVDFHGQSAEENWS